MVWNDQEVLVFEIAIDRPQPVNSTRYYTMVDKDPFGQRRFDLYVPDAIFRRQEPPSQLVVTISSTSPI
jgi:hypothetical protein